MVFNFVGCVVYISDAAGKMITSSTVTAHNKYNSIIDIMYVPELADQGKYELLILTAPSPYTYSCVAEVKGRDIKLKLFHGGKKEQRSTVRYAVNGSVALIAYLDEGKVFKLHSPLDAVLMNISQGGVRLKMKPNSLSLGDTVSLYIKAGKAPKVLNATVVNLKNNDDNSEYGCKLV